MPQQEWHLQARKEGDAVRLCISQKPECPQPGGITLSDISVYRYDNTFDNHLIWDTAPEAPEGSDPFDGAVTYGVAPKNWQNRLAAPAVACGKAYLVNPPALYFALKCDGTVVVFDPTHLEEFFDREASAAPGK